MREYTRQELIEIINEDNPEFVVVDDEVIGRWKWGSTNRTIVEHFAEGLFAIRYQLQPEEGIQEINQPKPVKKVAKTIEVYEDV